MAASNYATSVLAGGGRGELGFEFGEGDDDGACGLHSYASALSLPHAHPPLLPHKQIDFFFPFSK